MNMTKHDTIPFPLSDLPTRYLATLEDTERIDCTHVYIRLVLPTLIRLVWMHSVASVLRLVGIKIAIFETRVGALDIGCIKYQGKQFLGADEETSTDEAPYDCLSLDELANLGGYATDAVLAAHFTTMRQGAKVYTVEVHADRSSLWLKIYFFGQILSIETNAFNLDIIVEDLLQRYVQHSLSKYLNNRR
jgi:hypothetical protein